MGTGWEQDGNRMGTGWEQDEGYEAGEVNFGDKAAEKKKKTKIKTDLQQNN